MVKLDELRKKIEERKAKEKKFVAGKEAAEEAFDVERVEKIVDKMKKKYAEQGIEFEQVGGKLRELRGIVAEGEAAKIQVQRVEELTEFRSPIVQGLGRFYLFFGAVLKPISSLLRRLPPTRELAFYLYSANMMYSVHQWLAISAAASVIAFFIGLVLGVMLLYFLNLPLVFSLLFAILAFIAALVVCFIIPKSRAQSRGDAISIELPFALRHMATELKAGIGLYKTLQAIATADYGILSEEFSRTINEVEEGTDTKDALRHFALRTQCKALRNALLHVIRALKTGGNLSDIMNTIASDVSFELRMKMRDFGQKMNFFGVIFIMGAIVAPTFIIIIGGITNTPMQIGTLPLDPMMILIFYLVIMPLLLLFLIIYLHMMQPKV